MDRASNGAAPAGHRAISGPGRGNHWIVEGSSPASRTFFRDLGDVEKQRTEMAPAEAAARHSVRCTPAERGAGCAYRGKSRRSGTRSGPIASRSCSAGCAHGRGRRDDALPFRPGAVAPVPSMLSSRWGTLRDGRPLPPATDSEDPAGVQRQQLYRQGRATSGRPHPGAGAWCRAQGSRTGVGREEWARRLTGSTRKLPCWCAATSTIQHTRTRLQRTRPA